MTPLHVLLLVKLASISCVKANSIFGRYHYDDSSLRNTRPCKCMLVQAHHLYPNNFDIKQDINQGWQCVMVDASTNATIAYNLHGLQTDFIDTNLHTSDSARAYLSISSADIVIDDDSTTGGTKEEKELFGKSIIPTDGEAKIKISPNATLTITRSTARRALQQERGLQGIAAPDDPMGKHVMLVVRVSDATGLAPSRTATQLAEGVFSDKVNMRSQYTACSGGKIDFEPATVGTGVSNGVVDIKLSESMAGRTSGKVSGWAAEAFAQQVGSYDPYTHIMYVFPSSVDFGKAAAVGFVGWKVTLFSEGHASTLLVLMHELGHNLRQMHSGSGGVEYGDKTCMMGAHVYQNDKPKMCFNGAKSWYLNWYEDRHTTIDHPASWHGKLAGISDYLGGETTQKEHSVVVRVRRPPAADGTESTDNVYLMYNRKEGANIEVVGDGDKVTVIQQNGNENQSWKLAALDDTSPAFSIADWGGSGKDLVIQVCEVAAGTPDVARVLVYLSNNSMKCTDALTQGAQVTPTPPPTLSPTPAPTPKPTVSPTPAPTPKPTVSPTPAPTPKPTVSPTPAPTPEPSALPSASPSSSPSAKPSVSPSAEPTVSVRPSESPSSEPSEAPSLSVAPSTFPSSDPSAQPSLSAAPSSEPSLSSKPSASPSSEPSEQPTISVMPSVAPSSHQPSAQPTDSIKPSLAPSTTPSSQPSSRPSTTPSSQPSPRPSTTPSSQPSPPPTTSLRPSQPPVPIARIQVDE